MKKNFFRIKFGMKSYPTEGGNLISSKKLVLGNGYGLDTSSGNLVRISINRLSRRTH